MTPEVGVNQHTMVEGDYNVMTLQGNSRSYTLDRLKLSRFEYKEAAE